ncbi:hypothetical protein ACFYPN_16065 [Streptomyces sp. NPDC005576]|uniref:hypothetical protein n=1 Tax=Streptomyces sp. NPDC005576 TaxID=3364726 RepID=UPI0036CEC416
MADTNRGVGNTRPNSPDSRIGSTPGQWNPESGHSVPAPAPITRRFKVRAS